MDSSFNDKGDNHNDVEEELKISIRIFGVYTPPMQPVRLVPDTFIHFL